MTHPAGVPDGETPAGVRPSALPVRQLIAYLLFELVACAAFFAGPSEWIRTAGLVAVPALAGAAVVLGTRLHRQARRSAWLGLAAGSLLGAVGWGWMRLAPPVADGVDSAGVGPHVVFVLGYLVSAAGVVGLVGLRRRGDRTAVLDAGMLSIGLGLLVWVLVEPATPTVQLPRAVHLALQTYLVTDLLLIAVAARCIFAGVTGPRMWLLAGWAVVQATGDTGYAVQVLQGSFGLGSPIFVLLLAGYVAVGAAALCPPARVRAGAGGRRRALGPVVIGLAVLPLPLLLLARAVRGSSEDVLLIAVGSAAIAALALVRGVVSTESSSRAARAAMRLSVIRFVAGFLVLVLLPLAGLTYLAIHESDAAMRAEVRDRMEVTASVSAEYVGEEIRGLQELVSSYASRPNLVAALDRPGHPDLRAVDYHARALQGAHSSLNASMMFGPEGDLLAIRPPAPSVMGRNFAYRNYFRGALEGDSAYVSEAYVRAAPPYDRVISVSQAVRNAQGRTVGVVAIAYRLGDVRTFAKRLADVQGVSLTVTDQAGHLLAGQGSDVPGLPTSDDRRVAAALAGGSGTVSGRGENGPSVSTYRPVGDSGWTVVAEISDDVAFAGQRRQASRVLGVAVLLGQLLLAGLVLSERADRRRREAEASLSEREEHLRGVLHAASDAFVSMDADGRVIAWNDAAKTVFGHDPEVAIGADLIGLVVPPEARQKQWKALARLVGETPRMVRRRFELEAVHAAGHRFRAEVTLWQSSMSGAPSFNTFVRDVTERARRQGEVAEARDAALEASRLKSEFVANMSHEIRTPMNGVLGMTALLQDTPLDPVQRDYAETIAGSAEALLTVIDDILNFSKIEAGQLDIEAIDFELRPLVEDVATLLGPAAHGRGVELAVLIDPVLPAAVQGDPHRLRQVLTNLVGNAVKYTERGEVVVTVEPGHVDPSRVRIAVRDTGIGISGAHQLRLFEAFQQADASTTRRYGGTGLGLTISRRLVELMGGSLEVLSELRRGSTFFFEVPLPAAASLPTLHSVPADLAGTRILVVDDNATNRKVLLQLLASWSLRPTCVADGESALAELHGGVEDGRPYALVLLDMNMPDTNGLEFAAQVRADPRLALTALVMLTSSADVVERAAADAAGVDAYLAKPVRQLPLHDALVKLLADRPRDEAATVVRATPVLRGGRVLVAEDNVVNQRVVTGMLTALGYSVDLAVDGHEAVELAERREYDLVMMDCQMPRMDGFTAARAIRASGAAMPIVALTASVLEDNRERCLAAGMNDFLAKPLRRDQLAAVLTQWAGSGGESEVPARGPAEAGEPAGDPGDDVLHPGLLEEVVELGPEFLGNLVARFTETAPGRIDALEAAVLCGDREELVRIAHSLRGSSGTLAALGLSALLARAEEVAEGGGAVSAELLAEIRHEHDRVRAALVVVVSASSGSTTPPASA
jgi:PAS domain S-box-containing protein